jgi:hypothetical protein
MSIKSLVKEYVRIEEAERKLHSKESTRSKTDKQNQQMY